MAFRVVGGKKKKTLGAPGVRGEISGSRITNRWLMARVLFTMMNELRLGSETVFDSPVYLASHNRVITQIDEYTFFRFEY